MNDQSTYTVPTSAAKLAVLANADAKNTITVDSALDADSTNPVQNKVITDALSGKASTATAKQSSAGLMSAEDKTRLDALVEGGVGVTYITVDEMQDIWNTN